MINKTINNTQIEINKIRHHYDKDSKDWYFSIIDVIEIISESKDPRNYWKVLKNRLKKADNQLVTNCNQLKMEASDGKSYLTDVADSHTILEIIKIVSPDYFEQFDRWFDWMENHPTNIAQNNIKLSTLEKESFEYEEGELFVDVFENDLNIVVKSFLAGVSSENLSISIMHDMINISGKRVSQKNSTERNYLFEELFWGEFSRKIKLPSLIEIDKIETSFEHGLLIIKLSKIDMTRIKKIKL